MISAARVVAGPLLLLVAGYVMWRWTRHTWPDVMIDFGREVYVAWQLSEGAVLHRDVAYPGGPLAPALNALCFRVFGPGIDRLAAANAVVLLALVALWYRLLVICGGRFSATAGCLTLVIVFAFGRFSDFGSYNFIAPYTHDLTHGLLLATASVGCLVAHARRGGGGWLVGTGLLLGLVFLTKAETFAAAVLAVAGGLALTLRREGASGRRAAGQVGSVAVAALVPPLVAAAALAGPLGPGGSLEAVFGGWNLLLRSDVASLGFYREGMGIDDPGENLRLLLVWSLGYAALLVPALAASRILPRSGAAGLLGVGIVGLGSFGVIAAFADRIFWLQAVRPLPVGLVLLLAWALRGFGRDANDAEASLRWLARSSLVLLAAGLIAKIVLHARVYHYGFALAMPGVVVLVAAGTGWVPAQLDRRGRSGLAFRAASLGVLAAGLTAHLLLMAGFLDRASGAVGQGSDRLRTDPARAAVLGQALEAIRARSQPGQSLAVLPEGVMLNYLARRPLASPHYSFTPFDFRVVPERDVLRAFEATPPDLILVVHRETPEYGARRFGRDYALELHRFVLERYRVVDRFGDVPFEPGSRFGAQLLERRDRPE